MTHRLVLGVVLGIVVVTSVSMASPAHAQTSIKYCAQYNDGSSPDCEFTTLQMCDEAISGVGGVCIDNPYATPAAASPPPQYQYQGSSGAQYQTQMGPMAVPPPPFTQSSAMPQAPPPPAPAPQPCNPLVDGTYCTSQGGSAGGFSQSSVSMAPIQSVANDLSIGQDPPATLGAITFSGNGGTCIGLFRRGYCN